MFKIQVRLLAKNDIQEIIDYYDVKASKKITNRFLDDLYSELDFLKTRLESFQLKYKSTHVRYLKDFPFGIHYRIKNNIIVEVLAVLHTSRNPEFWKNR